MGKRYLFLASLTYSFPIMRPIQDAIRRRGGEAAWFFDRPGMKRLAAPDEKVLDTVAEVIKYDPVAVFTAGNHMYHFFPGVKVQVFHGFNIDKRPGRGDHFDLKGWFDLYCTQGETSTPRFMELSQKYRYFKVVETRWPKLDNFFGDGKAPVTRNPQPVILYCSTFTKWITSTPHLYEPIARLMAARPWRWIVTLHPLMDKEAADKYRALCESMPNAEFYDGDNNTGVLLKADVMVCDSSSIITEFLTLDKPVVTYKNTAPGPHLIDINDPDLLENAIETALSRPQGLMSALRAYADTMDPHRDGRSSERVLNAVDDLLDGRLGPRKRKPFNLLRKYKARKKLGYYKL